LLLIPIIIASHHHHRLDFGTSRKAALKQAKANRGAALAARIKRDQDRKDRELREIRRGVEVIKKALDALPPKVRYRGSTSKGGSDWIGWKADELVWFTSSSSSSSTFFIGFSSTIIPPEPRRSPPPLVDDHHHPGRGPIHNHPGS
jgi:hypothetical protein